MSQRQCVCPCTLVRLGEIRQANIVRSLVDRQRSPPPPEARSIDRRPVFPLPSEQWPGRSMSSATLRRHQFSRSVRNISDNNCIYQLFGASIRHLAQSNPPTRPKGQHRHGRSDLSLQRRPASGRGTRRDLSVSRSCLSSASRADCASGTTWRAIGEFPLNVFRIGCGRAGSYRLAGLIERFGADARPGRSHGAGGMRAAEEFLPAMRRAVH